MFTHRIHTACVASAVGAAVVGNASASEDHFCELHETVGISVAAPPSGTDGPTSLSLLVARISWTGSDPACSEAEMADRLLNDPDSMAAYYAATSFGQLTVVGDVVSVSIPVPPFTGCPSDLIADDADQALLDAGYDPASYDRRLYVLPGPVGCSWTGLGQFCGTRLWAGPTSCDSLVRIAAHELGHTLCMRHARSSECGFVAEYGDDSDVMGGGLSRLNAPHMDWQDWTTATIDISASGTYTIESIDVGPTPEIAPPQILRIFAGGAEFIYLSLRTHVDVFSPSAEYLDRVSVHTFSFSGPTATVLHGLVPPQETMRLGVGSTSTVMTISNVIVNGNYARFHVDLDTVDNAPPSIVMTAPIAGDFLTEGTITYAVQASDDVAIDYVEYYFDGSVRAKECEPPFVGPADVNISQFRGVSIWPGPGTRSSSRRGPTSSGSISDRTPSRFEAWSDRA